MKCPLQYPVKKVKVQRNTYCVLPCVFKPHIQTDIKDYIQTDALEEHIKNEKGNDYADRK